MGTSASKSPCLPNVKGMSRSVCKIYQSPYNELVGGCTFIINDNGEPESFEETAEEKAKKISQWEAAPLTFEAIFETLCILSEKFCSGGGGFFNAPDDYTYFGYSSNTEKTFLAFIEDSIKETVLNTMSDTMLYVSSSIINVKRLYPLESTDEFTQVLKRFIKAKRNLDKEMDYVPNTFFNKWVKNFGLGEKVSVNVDPEGLGITLRLHKDEADETGTLLADNGYGITQILALLLNIEVGIMERTVWQKVPDNLISALYTKEQLIKVFSSPTIAVEEPEIHLHPSYQSMLAEMFYDAYKNYGIHFLVETTAVH